MSKKHIHTKKSLEKYRRKLRSNATPAEKYLWSHLRSKQLDGLRFQRQHAIKNFIVDFYCASLGLIIELDGEVHNHPQAEEKDDHRDKELEALGFTILRFENKMVFENLEHIFEWIRDVEKKKNS
ncbi:endonuclease domain-containing protein [Nonlabens dokdonensis]|uniref:endonuclease domain-containing protein n=1 Tax=Nonlabens dokdonensis TaxID=328515 RepID=UPI0026F09253|nr:endonuclease domain-containing protein [Nonlabens dokdonensis]